MVQRKKTAISEKRKLRNIADYIYDCIKRLYEHAELLSYLEKHKKDFIDPLINETISVIRSIIDVYSRDIIIILVNVLDYNRKTSSLFTLVDHIKNEKTKTVFSLRLKKIKKRLDEIVFARGNIVAHFNTEVNTYERGFTQYNRQMQFNPKFLNKITKEIETLYGEVRNGLDIEGAGGFHTGEPITKSFIKLIGKGQG